MITVHHLENSRSQRVLWLLEEIGAPYEVTRYERDPETMLAPDALKQVHPLGKSPVIEDNGRVVAETGLIVEYLLARHGGASGLLPPADDPAHWDVRYWLHYAEGSAMPPLLLKLVFNRVKSADMPFFAKPVAKGIADNVLSSFVNPQVKTHMDHWEAALAKGGWFAGGRFTAADIMMSFPVEGAAARGGLGPDYPALKDFLERIHDRPAYRAALEKGGPFDLLR